MTIQPIRGALWAVATALLLARGTWAAEPPVAPAPKPTPNAMIPAGGVPRPLTDLQQLARCNPFRPIMVGGKPATGDATSPGVTEPGSSNAPPSQAAKTDRPPPADALTVARKSMVVSAIVSTDHTIYAVIGGKKFFVGDEVAPRVKISKITLSGITVAPLDDAPLP